MLTPRAGAALWLLRHDALVAWRGAGRPWLLAGVGGLLWLAMHLAMAVLLLGPASATDATATLAADPLLPALATAAWLMCTLMLSQAIVQSVDALSQRRDLDLLLSAPLPAAVVFTVRALGISVRVTLMYWLVLSPLVHVGVVLGRWSLLAIYPALLSLGLAATAAGMALTLLLVRYMGVRRARVVAQLLAALVGAALFIGAQAPQWLDARSAGWLQRHIESGMAPGGGLAIDGPWGIPLRALQGQWTALSAVLLAGLGGFGLLVRLTHRQFLAAMQAAQVGGVAQAGALRWPRRWSLRWSLRLTLAARADPLATAGLTAILLVKELRLMLREPQLLGRVLLQVCYLVPLTWLVAQRSDVLIAAAPGATLLAGSLAGNFARLTVAAEASPDLLASAPISAVRVRWIKLLAALLPAWVLVSPLLGMVAASGLLPAGVTLWCVFGCTLSVAAMQVGYPRPGRRDDLGRRTQSSMALGLAETLTSLAWATLAWLLLVAPSLAWLPVVPALLIPAAVWGFGARARQMAHQGHRL